MKHLPKNERPRERLAQLGPRALSTVELIAILLGTGTKQFPVLSLAAQLLSHFQTVDALARASLEELQEVKGIGEAKAILLKAALSLFERREESQEPFATTPEEVYRILRPQLEKEPTEVLLVLLRNAKGRIIHREEVARGILTEVHLHPREIFAIAIKHRAHSLIIAHNHPSGDPTPSLQDRDMTRLIAQAGQLIGIPLQDHLIIGKRGYFSFLKEGEQVLFS